MGTVGLNFGSPTSGTGFDVSATVGQIVTNLQKVEQPWKDQLTSLQSQDAAISSIGSLISKLSADVSALTDFNGILAQKTGSSSDNNVLELTSASNTAVAGTHTVVVSSLARTSSGYLAAIGNAGDTLTGSITFRVGNGKAHTVSVPSGGTLSSLAAAVNSSGAGVKASVLTDSSGSRLSLVSGSSGANGNIAITANSIVDQEGMALAYSGGPGSGSSYSSGTLSGIFQAADTLSGSITIQVGSGTATKVAIDSSNNTLSTLADAINTAALGVQAAVVTNGDGTSSLSLVSETQGSAGTLTVTSNVADTTPTLGYTATVTGADASLNVDGVDLHSASNTVSNLIPGVTFQLLSASAKQSDGTLEPIQVVIGNDNSGVESAISSMVTDYNALMNAINTQEGNDSSGKPEPLFGSPTLSLIQQQLLGSFNLQNPNGSIDAISDNTGTTLSGSIAIQVANGTTQTFTVGPGTNGVNNFFTGSGSDANTLQGLADAINAANVATPIAFSATPGPNGGTSPSSAGTLVADASGLLSGSITIQTGNGTSETIQIGDAPANRAANTVYTGSGAFTLQDLSEIIHLNSNDVSASVTTTDDGVATLTLTGDSGVALNVASNLTAASLGVSASVQTSNHQSYLMLRSAAGGASGALEVNSKLSATSNQLLSYAGSAGQDATPSAGATYSSGSLSGIPSVSDSLSGSLTLQAGNGATQTITLGTGTRLADGTPVKTLTALNQYIDENSASLGVSSEIVQNSGSNSYSLRLTANTIGKGGTLTVTSGVLDASNQTTTDLNYSNASDISSMGALGVSMNNDGTLTFDASALDTLLNTDFGGVVGMFQGVNSWGRMFANMLNNAGSSSSVGLLKLALTSNSNIEKTLNHNISREEAVIADQQKRLTAQLNEANQILQALPSQLNGMDQLYSAITGYNGSRNR